MSNEIDRAEADAKRLRKQLDEVLGFDAALRVGVRVWASADTEAEGDKTLQYIIAARKISNILDQLR